MRTPALAYFSTSTLSRNLTNNEIDFLHNLRIEVNGVTRPYYLFLWNASYVGVELCPNSDSYAKQDSKRYYYIITQDFALICCLDYFLWYSLFCLKPFFQVSLWLVTELLLMHQSENIQETKKNFSKCYWLSRSHWINVPFLLFAITFCILTILI